MPSDFQLLFLVAAAAALASPIGGAAALLTKPTSLFLSVAVGFAAGVMLGTIAFEMLPQAAQSASLAMALIGFATGFGFIYALDLFIHRGVTVGEHADQRQRIVKQRMRLRTRGDRVTVLAGGTSAEELVEGIVIGVSVATEPRLGAIVALAIFVDNVAESLSIGELILARRHAKASRRTLFWTGLIGFSLFAAALVGWLLLRNLSGTSLGFLLAAGAGGMFYLTVTELVPEAEKYQFNQSGAIAMAAGFLLIYTIAHFA